MQVSDPWEYRKFPYYHILGMPQYPMSRAFRIIGEKLPIFLDVLEVCVHVTGSFVLSVMCLPSFLSDKALNSEYSSIRDSFLKLYTFSTNR